jgi:Rieske Fe-S protein
MKAILIAMTTAAAVVTAAPMLAGVAKADPSQLAQADIDVRVGPRGPGVVIEEPRRRPGVVIETEGRRNRDCRTVSVTERQNGVSVTRTERRCD